MRATARLLRLLLGCVFVQKHHRRLLIVFAFRSRLFERAPRCGIFHVNIRVRKQWSSSLRRQ